MYAGEVVESAPTAELFANPKHPYTRALLNSIPGQVAGKRKLTEIPGASPNPAHPPAGCPFHPRCSDYMPGVCDKAFPAEVAIAEQHDVACHLYTRSVDAAA